MLDFTDSRVLVTGGARGIGAATVAAFLARGARVAIGARSQTSFDACVARLAASGGSPVGGGMQVSGGMPVGGSAAVAGLVPAIGDIRDRAGAQAVVAQAVARLGGLDILVNSAGVFAEVAIADVTQSSWDESIGINLSGTFFCAQAALAALDAAAGNIVNVASDAGIVGYPHGTAYSAAKGGVVNRSFFDTRIAQPFLLMLALYVLGLLMAIPRYFGMQIGPYNLSDVNHPGTVITASSGDHGYLGWGAGESSVE